MLYFMVWTIKSCKNAYRTSRKFEVFYERTKQVKEFKINRATKQYEIFQTESYESVYDM